MKIAVVLMPWYRRDSPSPELAMTISILKRQNHDIMLWDINSLIFHDAFKIRKYWKHFLLDPDYRTIEDFQNQTRDLFEYYSNKILSHNPDIIIFKCIGKSYDNSINLAQIIKEKNRDKIIILCGLLPTIEQDIELFVARQKKIPADFVICGEDEFALKEVVKAIEMNEINKLESIFDKKDKIINCFNGPRVEHLDDLPFFDFSVFDLDSYRFFDSLELFLSRGCPWRCAFCIDWRNEKYRTMSGERILNELLYQLKFHKKVKHFRFCDKTINGNIKVLTELCDLVSAAFDNGLFDRDDWVWSGDAMIRPEMTMELLRKMSRAKCHGIGYGLESGSEKVIKDMGKNFSIAVAEEVIRHTHLVNIKTSINILVGFPTETGNDFKETLNFIKRNREFIDEIRLTFSGLRIYPHSYLDIHSDKYDIVYPSSKSDSNPIDNWINRVDYWKSKDGSNTYEERIRRTEELCQLVLSLGIELRVNSRITRRVKINQNV